MNTSEFDGWLVHDSSSILPVLSHLCSVLQQSYIVRQKKKSELQLKYLAPRRTHSVPHSTYLVLKTTNSVLQPKLLLLKIYCLVIQSNYSVLKLQTEDKVLENSVYHPLSASETLLCTLIVIQNIFTYLRSQILQNSCLLSKIQTENQTSQRFL